MRRLAFGASLFLAACSGSEEPSESGVARTPDGEIQVWFQEGVPSDTEFLAVWGRSRNDVWAVGWDGTIAHYNGMAWQLETTTATVPLTGISGTPLPNGFDPDDPMDVAELGPVFAVGWGGTILQRQMDGSWIDAPRAVGTATVTTNLFDIYVHDDERALAVGDGGTVFAWDGTEWSNPAFRVPGDFSGELIEPRVALQGVWTPNGDDFTIVGSSGAAYRSQGVATGFASLDTRIAEPLRGVWGTGNGNVYAVGLDSIILRFQNGQWQRQRNDGIASLPTTFLFGVHGQRANDFLIVGWRGVAIRRANGLYVQEETLVDVDLRDVWVAPREQIVPYPDELPDVTVNLDVGFAVGTNGTILRRQPPLPTLEELQAP
ncbi:MAG: hypothetical protein AAGD10_17735 [Myxococcota bacterium]